MMSLAPDGQDELMETYSQSSTRRTRSRCALMMRSLYSSKFLIALHFSLHSYMGRDKAR